MWCTLTTTQDIAAPATTVWQVLTALAAYPRWNPMIRAAEGDVQRGGALHLLLRLPDEAPPYRLEARVLRARSPYTLCWRAHWGWWGGLHGTQCFALQEISPGLVRVQHRMRLIGLRVPFMRNRLTRDVGIAMAAMNRALRIRCEPRPSAAPVAVSS